MSATRQILEKRQERGFTFLAMSCGHLLRWHPGQEPGGTRSCPSCPATPHRIDTCGTCPAQIIWGVTVNGKPIPLNADPDAAGNALLDERGRVTINVGDAWTPIGSTRHIPHHATCPIPIRH